MTYARAEQLTADDATFYQTILREFPRRGGPPDAAWLAAEAAARGLDAEATLAHLAQHDLIVRDPATGTIRSMYPFSAAPTPHRVSVEGARPVYAMCAVDALGIPFMLERDAVIESLDPTTDMPIRVEVRGGEARWEPPTAAVLTASIEEAQGPKAISCCPVINFFATAEAAEAYRAAHPAVAGRVLTQEEAVAHGKRYFGGLLAPDGPTCGCDGEACGHRPPFERHVS
ncbi:MAG: alkylmercury lyase family protein [Dehalococcoidia bacterium]